MSNTANGRGPARLRDTQPGFTGRVQRQLLLVEPDLIFAKLVRAYLEDRGWQVSHFSSGRKAIAAARTFPAQVILSSLDSDDIDGFAVVEQLGRVLPGVPIVFCVPHAGVNTWDQAVLDKLGVTAALARPIRFQRLELIINGALAGRGQQDSDQESETFRLDNLS
jgi:DNA-binding NtrC family response regulator